MSDIERKASHSIDEKSSGLYGVEIIAGSQTENVGGAPIEQESPLGRQVGALTVIALNISMMIGTGICESIMLIHICITVIAEIFVTFISRDARVYSQGTYSRVSSIRSLIRIRLIVRLVAGVPRSLSHDLAYWSGRQFRGSGRLQRIRSVVPKSVWLRGRLP